MKKLICLFAAALVLVACGKDPQETPKPTPEPEPVKVESVSVAPDGVTLEIGDTQQLTATVLPANADNKSVTWSSEPTSVATVSESGLVTAISGGEATITVTTEDGAKTATATVTVNEPEPEPGIQISAKMRTLPSDIDPDSRLVVYEVSPTEWEQFLNPDFITDRFRPVTMAVYEEFNDEFDFLYLALDNDDPAVANDRYHAQASSFTIQSNVKGIGMPDNYYDTNYMGGKKTDRLKSIFLAYRNDDVIRSQILPHELMHNWGISIYPYEQYPQYGNTGGHTSLFSWPGGQLGGFGYVRLVDENRWQISAHPETNPDGSFVNPSYGLVQTAKYSDLELYLAGWKSADELREEGFHLDFYLNAKDVGEWTGTFTADGVVSRTIDDIIADYGQRVPDASTAQKDFRMLTVIITPEGTPDSHFRQTIDDLEWVSGPESWSDPEYLYMRNFTQVASGRATLKTDGIKDSLK